VLVAHIQFTRNTSSEKRMKMAEPTTRTLVEDAEEVADKVEL
jgi:hypothetical protein